MPTFTFTSPEGKTYDITGPEGATKEQAFGILQSQLKTGTAKPVAPAPTTAGQRARQFVGGLNLKTAEQDPGFRAVEQGAAPEAAGPVAAAKALGKYVPAGVKRAAGDWLDKLLTTPNAEQRAASILQKTASNPAEAAAKLKGQTGASPLVKNARQTSAAAASDEGLLGLEKTTRNFPGASERAGREVATPSNTARSNVISAMAGDAERLAAAKTARQQTADNLYRAADKTYVNVDKPFRDLMERPSIQSAIKKATQLAKEEGAPLQPGDLPKPRLNAPGATTREVGKVTGEATARPSAQMQVSGRGLHYLKMALDQQIEREGTNALTRTQRRLVSKTRDDFLKWTEDRIPEYKQAKEAYRQASKPINRMELMQKIQAKATSNATDAQGNKIITRNGFQNAIKQYRKDLDRTMTPAQLKHIDQISRDLDNAEKVNSPYIKPAGSETVRHAQAASAANVLGRLTGGHGVTAAAMQLISRVPAFGWLRDVPPEATREILIDAMLDPELARQLLLKPTPKVMNDLAGKLQGVAQELGYGPNVNRQLSRAALATANNPEQQ